MWQEEHCGGDQTHHVFVFTMPSAKADNAPRNAPNPAVRSGTRYVSAVEGSGCLYIVSNSHFTFTFAVLVVSLPRISITLTTAAYSPGPS